MSVKQFISGKLFLRQLMLAFAVGIVIIWGSLKLLDVYTHHGRTIVVPDLEGLSESAAGDLLESYQLRYQINDSIFDDERDKGTISSQDPVPGTEVKKNRTIYLTLVAIMPEMVPMPDLTDLSLRQAMSMLETHGLKPELIRLPVDAEWEKAAGGKENDRYAWDHPRESSAQETLKNYANTAESGIGRTTPVWTYPKGRSHPYGLFDMSGNVWEWQANQSEALPSDRVLRGGSFIYLQSQACCSGRGRYNPNDSLDDIGFRLCLYPL